MVRAYFHSNTFTEMAHSLRRFFVATDNNINLYWLFDITHHVETLLKEPRPDHTRGGRPARTYIDQLVVDTGCPSNDLPAAMQDRDGWHQMHRPVRPDWLIDRLYMILLHFKIPHFVGVQPRWNTEFFKVEHSRTTCQKSTFIKLLPLCQFICLFTVENR